MIYVHYIKNVKIEDENTAKNVLLVNAFGGEIRILEEVRGRDGRKG